MDRENLGVDVLVHFTAFIPTLQDDGHPGCSNPSTLTRAREISGEGLRSSPNVHDAVVAAPRAQAQAAVIVRDW